MTNEATKFSNEIRWSVPWYTDTEHGVAIVDARSGDQAQVRALALVYRETRQHAHTWGVAYPRG